MIKKVKDTVPGTYDVSDLNGWLFVYELSGCGFESSCSDLKDEEVVGTFYKKDLQKANQKEFRIEKIIKRKGD